MSSDRFTVLYEFTPNISLIHLHSTSVCWHTGDMLEPDDLAVALHFDDVSRFIGLESRVSLINSIKNHSENPFISRVAYEKPIMYKGKCLVCDSDPEEGELVYSLSEFVKTLESWIHSDCREEFYEVLRTDVSTLEPDILAYTI